MGYNGHIVIIWHNCCVQVHFLHENHYSSHCYCWEREFPPPWDISRDDMTFVTRLCTTMHDYAVDCQDKCNTAIGNANCQRNRKFWTGILWAKEQKASIFGAMDAKSALKRLLESARNWALRPYCQSYRKTQSNMFVTVSPFSSIVLVNRRHGRYSIPGYGETALW